MLIKSIKPRNERGDVMTDVAEEKNTKRTL